MWDFIVCGSLILVAGLLVATLTNRWDPWLRVLVWAGLAAHVVSTFVLVWVVRDVYGVGDLLSYLRQGRQLAEYLRYTGRFGDVAELIAGGDPPLPVLILGAGSPTGSTSGIAGVLLYLLDSDWGVNLCVSLLAFSGQVATFVALRDLTPRPWHARLLFACVPLPSAVFWTSGVLKETLAVWGLGWLVYALTSLQRRRYLRALLLGIIGVAAVALIKAYILFPLVASAGILVYWQGGIARYGDTFRVRPSRMLAGALIAVLGVVVLGEFFPRYSVENLGEEAVRARTMGEWAGGGSYFEIGNTEDRSLFGQLAFAPVALFSALFRPLPFEINNAAMAVNALETTAIAFLIVRLFLVRGWAATWNRLRRSPALMGCLTMTLLLAIGIGLTTTNMGTLSRYRVPMMPFYVGLLLVLLQEEPRPAGAQAPSPSPALHARPRRIASHRSTTRSRA